MREILFRGKRIDNGEWVEGFYNHIPCGRFLCDEHCIQTIKQDGRIGQLYDVYDSTVEQFTGLNDKNGKKIFEGDIVASQWCRGVVCCGEFNCSCCDGVYGWYFYGADIREYDMYEVIGNIHDNPELLGGTEDG